MCEALATFERPDLRLRGGMQIFVKSLNPREEKLRCEFSPPGPVVHFIHHVSQS